MADSKIIIAFDLYGTLLSTESIAKQLATHFGDSKADIIATLWRRYQLEYTWRLNSMSIYRDFSEVTRAALLHALSETSETLSKDQTDDLMKAYDSLSTFPDADAGLKALESDNSISAYIFSNGANAMVASSVKDSPSLSPFSHVFKDIITVEDDRAFKPVMEVYLSMARKVDGGHGLIRKEKIWLVSSNPFDIVGAKVVGMKAAWVDRKGTGWHDRLGDLAAGGPTIIVKGVDEAVAGIKEWEKKKKNGI